MPNRILRNASWIIACKVCQAILGLVISMLTARYFGPQNFGIINYAASLTTVLTPIALLGFNVVLIKRIVSEPEHESTILGTAVLSSAISGILCVLAIYLFVSVSSADDQLTIVVCTLYSTMLVMQGFELIQYWFQAKLLSKYASLMTLFAYTFVAILQIVFLVSGKSIVWFASIKAIEYALIAVGLMFVYRKLTNQTLSFSLRCFWDMFRESRYYILSNLMVMMFAQADRIMLKFMMSSESMGFYSAAVGCANLTEFVFLAIIDSFRSTVIEKKAVNQSEYESLLRKLYSVMIYLSLLQSVFITILAKPIILVLYGRAYLPAVVPLRIIVWYTAFSYLGSARIIWILAEKQETLLWKINSFGAILNIILNWFMIPVGGIAGAAIASLLTQFTVNFGIGLFVEPLKDNNMLIIQSCRFSVIRGFVSDLKK